MNSDDTSNSVQEICIEENSIPEDIECEMTGSNENINQIRCEENSRDMSMDRPTKRNREINSEEIWTTVARKAKRFGRTGTGKEITGIPEDKIEVSITCLEKLPKQFGLAKMLKSENIPNVIRVKYINAYKALIQFNNEDSAELLLQSKVINEKFKCQKTFEINQSYGVIKDIDLDLTEEEIMQALKSDSIILGVKRLKRRNSQDGHWEISESVRVCFKGSYLPTHIYIYDMRVQITTYIYPVTQCSRCWRFGHTIRMCPSNKIVCPKCTLNHPNCETATFQCNNCSGKHMAMAKICPIFIKEKKIRELMAEFNCSYKRALTLYVPLSPGTLNVSQHTPSTYHNNTRDTVNFLQDEITPDASVAPTYANITKKNVKKATENRKNRKGKTQENYCDTFDYLSDISENINYNTTSDQPNNASKPDNKEISWQILFKKLKDKIFEVQSGSWENKVKACINILFEGLISLVQQYIKDWPCLNFIKQLWIGTTHTSQ